MVKIMIKGGIIEAILKDKAEDLLEIIRSGMQESGAKSAPSKKQNLPPNYSSILYSVMSSHRINN